MTKLRLTIMGSGSSGGVPRIGNDWGACDPMNPKNRRRRCSVLLESWADQDGDITPTSVIIDTSPDLREQLLDAKVSRTDGVVFTHAHADQCHGIDDLRVLAHLMRAQVPCHMDRVTRDVLVSRFDYCFSQKKGSPYPAILREMPLIEPLKPVSISGPGGRIELLPLDQDHGSMRSLGFRIGSMAYCNDVVSLPVETMNQLHCLDILVIDALRDNPHPTHANVKQALEWISELRPKRAVLTNLHVDLDYEDLKGRLPDGVEPAFDGMELITTFDW